MSSAGAAACSGAGTAHARRRPPTRRRRERPQRLDQPGAVRGVVRRERISGHLFTPVPVFALPVGLRHRIVRWIEYVLISRFIQPMTPQVAYTLDRESA